ncbi:hypothetical protein T492DRAFT_158172 [Pavlovales sp. CCMP2436]|nr:hypothetical protein T492DRAFT_158172 [Pavlovales sp. CCMP2436]
MSIPPVDAAAEMPELPAPTSTVPVDGGDHPAPTSAPSDLPSTAKQRTPDEHLTEGLAAARALCVGGMIHLAGELARALKSACARGMPYRESRTAAALDLHCVEAAEATAAKAAKAEADLLSATVGAAARLARAAELAASRAGDAAEARRQLEAATKALAQREVALETALRKGLTPQAKREQQEELRATQQEAAELVTRLEGQTAEAIEAANPRNVHRATDKLGLGRMLQREQKPFVALQKEVLKLQGQLADARAALYTAESRARNGPSMDELEAVLKKSLPSHEEQRAVSAARSHLGLVEKDAKLAAAELVAADAACKHSSALAAEACAALAAAEADDSALAPGSEMRALLVLEVGERVRAECEAEVQLAATAAAAASEQLLSLLHTAFAAVCAIAAMPGMSAESDGSGATLPACGVRSQLQAAVPAEEAPLAELDAYFAAARVEAAGCLEFLQKCARQLQAEAAAEAARVHREKLDAKAGKAAERADKRAAKAVEEAAKAAQQPQPLVAPEEAWEAWKAQAEAQVQAAALDAQAAWASEAASQQQQRALQQSDANSRIQALTQAAKERKEEERAALRGFEAAKEQRDKQAAYARAQAKTDEARQAVVAVQAAQAIEAAASRAAAHTRAATKAAAAAAPRRQWQVVSHAATGRDYWWNSETGETTWSNPEEPAASQPAAQLPAAVAAAPSTTSLPASASAMSAPAAASTAQRSPLVAAESAEVTLPWTAVPDASGKPYYWNTLTGEVSWVLPQPETVAMPTPVPKPTPAPAPRPAPVPMPAPQKMTAVGVWVCSVCTFENEKPHALVCEMCEATRVG